MAEALVLVDAGFAAAPAAFFGGMLTDVSRRNVQDVEGGSRKKQEWCKLVIQESEDQQEVMWNLTNS